LRPLLNLEQYAQIPFE
ncbi:hypothetical protein D030_2201B, partial [Vibrio parahaemolyticus AQ3810]